MSFDAAFHDLVSGRRRGAAAAVLRGLLGLCETPYGWIVARRNGRYDRGAAPVERVAAPVISVGNLTVGGTGKTPFVAWLGRWFGERTVAVSIISRGYGAKAGQKNDEALELAERLPGVPQWQNPDRVAAARQALRTNPRQILILDDAFQHRRLARDLDIVLLDALNPFGYGRLLPRGLLREPASGLARAQVVALSRCDAVREQRRGEIEREVRELAPQALWLELSHRPTRLVSATGEAQALPAAAGETVAAFCGLGNPAGFQHTLATSGFRVAGFLALPDHCPYDRATLERLTAWLRSVPEATSIVCTRKDLVKLPHPELADRPLFALDIELHIERGQRDLEALLEGLAQRV